MRWAGLALLTAAIVAAARGARAQPEPGGVLPRVFLDCGVDCADDYYRQALSYFDWVRDRHEADFAIRVVSQVSSNGGWKYTVTLRKPRTPLATDIVRSVATQPDDPPASARDKLRVAMLHCLYEALRGTPHESRFKLSLPRRSDAALSSVRDGWDHWVFAPELLAEVDGESNYYWLEVVTSLNIRRITETSKLRSVTLFSRKSTGYVNEEGDWVSGHTMALAQRLVYAHSVGRHWALGALGVAAHDEYENKHLHLHGGPIIEWNAFPYDENASRQLRFAYQAGPWYSRYIERTVRGVTTDLVPYHALSMIVDLNQAWGSVQGVVQGNSFMFEPKRWRLSVGLLFSISVVAGLALQFEGQAAFIQDQINLRERELTDDEIFVEVRELPKEFSYTALFGFSYTFGSVHNTIVNPRFGRVDLEEEK